MSILRNLIPGAEAPFFTQDVQVVLTIDGDTKTSAENGSARGCMFAI